MYVLISFYILKSTGPIFKALIAADLRQSNICGTSLVPKETFGNIVISWGITKDNRYTETYNRAYIL